MSGDRNQYQKDKSYLDFECPRCGHCCQALAQPEQEPVAWMHTTGTGHAYFRKKPQDKVFNPQPVFTAPPKKQWVGLTEPELHQINPTWPAPGQHWDYEDVLAFARAVEAKLKEKNT